MNSVLHNSFSHTKFKFVGLNFEKFCCVIRNWDRNFQIQHYQQITQILKQDNSIFRGLSDFSLQHLTVLFFEKEMCFITGKNAKAV